MGRINKQIEREEVLKPCLNLCDWLLKQRIILQYRNLDALDKDHKIGSPDIELHVPIRDIIWLLMAECKKSIGGRISGKQIEYANKYKPFKNVIYRIVTSKEELQQEVELLTNYSKDQLDSITL